jgi:hypothetical protein
MDKYPDHIWMVPRLLEFVDINHINELTSLQNYLNWACLSLGFEVYNSVRSTY